MDTELSQVIESFTKKVNLLIVDDDENLLDTVADLFRSPLLNIAAVSSSSEAQRKLLDHDIAWHCSILDIAMEKEDSGLRLLERISGHPAAIVLSGLGSMNMASKATALGAQTVLDKNPAMLDTIVSEVSRLAPIGFLLGGKSSPYQSTFGLLAHKEYDHPDQWADDACITFRQLQRICALYSSMTPRMVLATYYGIRFLLGYSRDEITSLFSRNSPIEKVENLARIRRSIDLLSKGVAASEDP